jgi:hypothetical protein
MSLKNFLLVNILIFSSVAISAQQSKSEINRNEVNLNFDDDDFLFDLGRGPVRQACSGANIIIPSLFECKILDILKNDIFFKTNDLNGRSLLDMPLFQTSFPKDDALTINLNFFFNKTDRSYFTEHSNKICSYLALVNSPLEKSIVTSFTTILNSECGDFIINTLGIPSSVFKTNVNALFGLFSNGTVEERRAGFMADIYKSVGSWTVGLKVPIYWRERNLFLSQGEIDAIQKAGLVFESSPNDAEDFQSNHIISDKVGFGDARIFAAYQFLDKNDATISLGAQVTIPSALAVQKGVVGSEFRECLKDPSLDLCDILNLGLDPASLKRRVFQELGIFGIDFLDRLSAMLSDCSLGNKGHWGLGLFLEPAFNFNNSLAWRTHLSVEQLLPAGELRFFTKKFDEAAFDAHNFASSDEVIAEENLRFINQRILDMFFPTPLCINVLPGIIVFCSNYLTYTPVPSFSAMIGLDYWYQGQERFSISSHSTAFDGYNVEKARNPWAQQLKILGGASYNRGTPDNGWILSLNGDITIFSTGIGKDYTLALSIKRTW